MEKHDYVIGIDQSYTRTGITILKDKEIVEIHSLDFKGCKTNSEKRELLKTYLSEVVNEYVEIKQIKPLIITERIRLQSQRADGKSFISEDYIKATGALVGTIIDVCVQYNLPVYSVSTQSWKAQVVGTTKPQQNDYGIDPKKYPTILYMRKLGLLKHIVYKYEGRGKKGVISVKIDGEKTPCKINDDMADSYCIAQYGFVAESKQKLKEEKF